MSESFTYSRGRNEFDNIPVPKSCDTFAEFREAVLSDRDGSAFICSTFRTGPHTKDREKYPGEHPFRCKDYALARAWHPFDLDGIENGEALSELILRCGRYSGFAYSTRSSTPDAPRARLVFELTRELTREEQLRFGPAFAAKLVDGLDYQFDFDDSVDKPEQPLFLPGPTSNVFRFDGEPVNPDDYLTQKRVRAPESAPERVSRGTREQWLTQLRNGDSVHDSARAIALSLANQNVPSDTAFATLESLLTDTAKHRDQKRIERMLKQRELSDLVESAYAIVRNEQAKNASGFNHEPIDVFAEHPVPPFPAEVMPESWRRYASSLSASSGFDEGAYHFTMMLHAGCLMDHRSVLRVNSKFNVPPFIWGSLVEDSGGGKSVVLNAAGAFAMEHYDEIHRQSAKAHAEWRATCAALPKNEAKPDRPPFKQRRTDDSTVEALVDVLVDTPEGCTLAIDELTGWLGAIDAYTGKGVSKDRPLYLDAWSGRKNRVINRRNRGSNPVSVPHWALGIIGAIQPEVLGDQFKRSGSTDGLIQRFVCYRMQPPKAPDLLATVDPFAEVSARNVFRYIAELGPVSVGCDREAVLMLQEYMTAVRIIAERSPTGRFREHLGKFPGFVGRIALTLHAIRQGGESLTAETMRDAIAIMRVLYRHSEAVYAILDGQTQEARGLTLQAAEAILSQGWEEFTRSDLSRHTANWRDADGRDAEAAIDQLIEMAWLHDITDIPRNRRGRPADGRWLVNPEVHARFCAHAERVTRQRAERHQAIGVAAVERAT